MKIFILFLTCVAGCLAAVEVPGAEGYLRQLVLHRISNQGTESLLTPVARYTDAAGRTVDLVGAIHLADAAYYRNLNRAFLRYDKVLYEMVDGENLPEQLRLIRKVEQGAASLQEQERMWSLLREQERSSGKAGAFVARYYLLMAELLGLQLQNACIDYSIEQMVFADLSSEEFAEAMKVRGESWLTLAIDAVAEDISSKHNSLVPLPMVPRSTLRREMVRALAAGSAGTRLQHRAIILARNERCFEVLDRELKDSSSGTRLAIFYGAMHLLDMHQRLLARGFTLQGVQWLTAIRA